MRDRPLIFIHGTLRPGSGHPSACRLLREAIHPGPATARGTLRRVAHFPGFVAGRRGTVRGDLPRLRDGASFGSLDADEMCGPSIRCRIPTGG